MPDPAIEKTAADIKVAVGTSEVQQAAKSAAAAVQHPTAETVVNVAGDVERVLATPIAHELLGDVPAVVKESKAGYKTTEFWLALLLILLTQLGALHLPGHYGATITTLAAGGAYILSRGLAKSGVTHVEPSAAAVAPVSEIVQREEGALT